MDSASVLFKKTGDGRLASRRAVGGWTEKTDAVVPTQATHRKLSDINSQNYNKSSTKSEYVICREKAGADKLRYTTKRADLVARSVITMLASAGPFANRSKGGACNHQ